MNHNQITQLQRQIARMSVAIRDNRPDLIRYVKSAKEAVGGAYLTSGEAPEALQRALPRLAIYAEMGEHLIALGDLADKMEAVIKEQASPAGKIILPPRMIAQRAAAEPVNGKNPTEEHAGRLYEVYRVAIGAFTGEPLPPWATLSVDPIKREQRHAWIAVAAHSLSTQAGG